MLQQMSLMALKEQIQQLLNRGYGKSQIISELKQQGYEDVLITNLINETAQIHYDKLRMQGIQFFVLGAVLCLAGFILALTASYTNFNLSFALYGLTGAGLILIFLGFMKVF